MSHYTQGYEDGVTATKAEYLKLIEEESNPAKELTDEEIALVWDKFSALPSPKDIKDFARSIIKKAQEK